MKKNQPLLSLLALGMLAVAPVTADDVVKLTTTKATGESISLQVNQLSKGATVDWGDGQTVAVSSTTDNLLALTGTVKGSNITVSSPSKITTLVCSGSGLSAIDLSGATNLYSLYCQDNALTTLDLSKCAKLTDLNCARNSLTSISLSTSTHANLQNINVADNGMKNVAGSETSTTFVFRNKALQHLDASNNAFTALTVAASNKELDELKCSGNNISSLNLSYPDSISVLMASDNNIGSITFSASKGLPALRTVILNGNKLSTLNLADAKELQYLDVKSNQLTKVTLPSETKFYAYACGDNQLTASSLPTSKYKPDSLNYLPQVEEIDITSLLKKTSWGEYFAPLCPAYGNRNDDAYYIDLAKWALDANGSKSDISMTCYGRNASDEFVELSKATNSNRTGDYFAASSTELYGRVTFLTAQDEAYVKFTSKTYPDLVNYTTHFKVMDTASGINDASTGTSSLSVNISNRTISLSATTNLPVRIYTSAGKLVWGGVATPSTTTIQLPAGVYIVNGKKVVL